MTDRLRVAGLGAGYFSGFHYDAWHRIEGADLVAICDLDAARARDAVPEGSNAGTYTDLAAMLDGAAPDLLDVIVPPAGHLAAIEQAAVRGIAVICQKPFCGDLATARRAVETCANAGVALIVHENFRFQPWYREIKRLIDGCALGTLYQATFRLRPGDGQGPDAYVERQPYFRDMKRFLVHETAIHFIDTFRFLFGEPATVYADLRRLNPAIAGEDAATLIFGFDDGFRAIFDGNRLVDHASENRRLTMGEFLIEGSAASLRLDGNGAIAIRAHGQTVWRDHAYAWTDRGFGGDCVHALQSHVVRALRGSGEVENTGADYIANLRLEEETYRAHERGAVVGVSFDGPP